MGNIFCKEKKKPDRETADLDHQIKDSDMEMQLLKHKSEVAAWPPVNCVNYWNKI